MKALVYTGRNFVAYLDEPNPVAAEGEVLVRVEAVGICGSDMHAYHGYDERRPAPLILGHEAAGTVISDANAGRRVIVNPLVTCGVCDFCIDGRSNLCKRREILSMPPRQGAFAEYVRVPERNLIDLPARLSFNQAALAEPIAVAYHAVKLGLSRLRRPAAASRAVVLGGGAIGLASALCLALQGLTDIHVAEPHPERRRAVDRAGDFRTYEPGSPGQPPSNFADLVIDAVGADATRADASALVKPGGAIVHVGLLPGDAGVDIRKLTLQEISLVGSYCYTMLDFRETVAAMGQGRLGALDWFEERPLSEGARALQELDDGRANSAKTILHP